MMTSPFDLIGAPAPRRPVQPMTREAREALRAEYTADYAGLCDAEVDALYYGLHYASAEALVSALNQRGWRVRLER
jgi:hypothetical protein